MSIPEVEHVGPEEFQRRYREMTAQINIDAVLTRELVGGMPAAEEGVRAFCIHKMGLAEGPELDAAVARILKEEVGETDVTPQTDPETGKPVPELTEKLSYGVNVIRRDHFGVWIGDWMVKAMFKASASRLNLFTAVRGVKADFAEMGSVEATGNSARDPHRSYRIYLVDDKGEPVKTTFERFNGRVSTPQGSKSIVNDCEVAPEGTRFSFSFRLPMDRITNNDILDTIAAGRNIGLGSAKSFERGKFEVLDCTIQGAERLARRVAEKPAPKAKKPKKGEQAEQAE